MHSLTGPYRVVFFQASALKKLFTERKWKKKKKGEFELRGQKVKGLFHGLKDNLRVYKERLELKNSEVSHIVQLGLFG